MLFDMTEGLQSIKNKKTTQEHVFELLRRKLVSSARCGKKLIINIGTHVLDFHEAWTSTTKIFDSSRVFDRNCWKDSKYHMQIVQKDENYDSMMTMGNYHMKEKFEIVFCARHVSDEQQKQVIAGIPHADKFRVVNIVD
jgi:hypothetical protein